MKSVTVNFRDKSDDQLMTEDRVLVVYEDELYERMSVTEKDAEDVFDDEWWVPISEIQEALMTLKGETHDAE